jgi:hypothetical protein
MPTYRLYFLDESKHIVDFKVLTCSGDDEARERAATLSNGQAMELWQGASLIAVMVFVVDYAHAWDAFAMGSVSHAAVAGARSKHDAQDEAEISKAAKLLIDQHGKDADIVAARRADALLRDGNTTEGRRWLEIFRKIAMSFLSRAL